MTLHPARGALAALAGLMLAAGAQATDLTIGVATEITSVDPHFHNLAPNSAFARHVFDRLVHQGPNQELNPGLAVSWQPVDDTTWEFKLREGVTFHDGSPFTADDVAFTFERAPDVPNSPSGLGTYLKALTAVEVIDDHTIHVKTAAPHPMMPNDLSTVSIISRAAAEDASTEDFNSGKAAIGTGPFEFVEWVPGDRAVVEKNPHYWGEVPEWDKVIFKPISSGPARVAALLTGDVDVAEVPTADVASLKNNPDINLSSGISNRLIYLHVDSDRDESPFVMTEDGQPLVPNPLKDVRVRKAISKAINRDAIVERVMEELAIPAGQLLPEGFFGTVPDIGPETFDPDGAKELLAEAGYPDGFKLTIHGPNDRYINDAKIAQAVAQMLTRVGIETDVVTMPRSVYFSRASDLEFSFILVGLGSSTGDASASLRILVHTYDEDSGFGNGNRGRYSNPEVDRLIEEALATVDDAKRESLLQAATRIAIEDVGIIPLHFPISTWGTRKGLTYVPRTDSETLAIGVVAEG